MQPFPLGILGAGLGSRLRSQAKTKPLVEIAGETLLARLQRQFRAAGITQISCALREELLSPADKAALPGAIDYIFVNTESSLHTLVELAAKMRPQINTLFSMADTVMRTEDVAAFVHFCQGLEAHTCALLVTPHVDDESPLWVAVDEQGRVTSLGAEPARFVTSGMYFLSPEALQLGAEKLALGTHKMRNFLSFLLASKIPIKTFVVEKTIDVDHPSDLEKAKHFLTD